MSRVDFYDDPTAPVANGLRVAASAVVQDELGRLLLQRRRDNGLWALPGGGMDVGENIGRTASREVEEETGYVVEPTYVIGVYSDPRHVLAYDDGAVWQEFSVCIACRLIGGVMAISEESHDVAWFLPEEVEQLDMHPRIRVRILDYLAGCRAVVG